MDLFTVRRVELRIESDLCAVEDPLGLLLAAALPREYAVIATINHIIVVQLLAIDLLAGLVADFLVIVHQSKACVVRDQAQLHLLIAVFHRKVPKLDTICRRFLLL